MVGTVNFEHRWNLTDVDDFDLDVDVSLYLVLGGQMSAMMFFWGAALSLIIWIHMQHTYSYARTHASFYDRCGVDRAWGPGHAYLK
ncbi:hypothetical protein BaRGS_00021142 [Batillaria attramentaria]|uniref:Uncharacterized protein n=1 Tax=Batillaria attramentaria TaxID=370345 RepID=A0ABD0KKI7_9CAEN